MARILLGMDVYLSPEINCVTEEGFWTFLTWGGYRGLLKKSILDPFQNSVQERIGYSDTNRPGKNTEDPLEINDLRFNVTTRLTTKRPSYKKINTGFGEYLGFLLSEYKNKRPIKGVFTINQEPYIEADGLILKLESDKKGILEGKDGISQSIKLVSPAGLASKIPEGIPVDFFRDYSSITGCNGAAYTLADNLRVEGNKRTGPFKEILLKDTMESLRGELEKPIALSYPFGKANFIHQVEPRRTPKHSAIINAFIREPPKRFTKKSAIGDLHKAVMAMEGTEGYLRDKGLIDDDFMEDYRPVTREGRVLVRLEGLRKRHDGYMDADDFVTSSIEQNIIIAPPGYGKMGNR